MRHWAARLTGERNQLTEATTRRLKRLAADDSPVVHAGVATALAWCFGVGLGWVFARTRLPGRGLLEAICMLPLVLPPVVTGWLLLLAFGAQGMIGRWLAGFGVSVMFRWTGAAIASAIMAFPLMVRAMRLSIAAVDRRFESAARTLGASRLRVFWGITLPMVMPGILAGLVLGFARSLGEFGATITFVSNIPGETQTLPSAIYTLTQVPGGDAGALKLTLISVVISMAALLGSELLARRARGRRAAT